MTKRVKTAIFISGRGSNMVSLLDACKSADFPAEAVLVLSNTADAAGLLAAQKAGIATRAIIRKNHASTDAYDAAVTAALVEHDVDLICLAGFMQLLSKNFVEMWRDRMINIHPSLLPSFKGLHSHERALERGVKFTGCTVHYVRYEMDTGPIITQAVVPVYSNDSAEKLAARVLDTEHRIYPHALKLVASNAVRVEGERIISTATTNLEQLPTLISPALGAKKH